MSTVKHIRRVRNVTEPLVHVRARSLSPTVYRSDTSKQAEQDTLLGVLGGIAPLIAPYDIDSVLAIYDQSNMLKQCIAAYVTNIAMYGWEIVSVDEKIEQNQKEVSELQAFIDYANSEESLMTLHSKVVEEYEKIGHSYIEVVRDSKGRVSILRHAKASLIRICPKNPDQVRVKYDVSRGPRVSMVTEFRLFRIYVQIVGGKQTFFKEFGDPRRLHCRTGKFEDADNPVPPEEEATELIHFRQNSEDAYGIPRWINQLPAILGSREAEEVNLRYFEDNTVPPMILSVAGGRLTGESFREMKKLLNSQKLGKERQNQILLIEAVPERESLEDRGNVQLKVDKLTDARPSDGLFKDYDESNQAKIRSSFRLPPISVGYSESHTYATANVSAFVAETQVFAPMRAAFDEIYNKRFVNHIRGLNLKTVCLRSKAPAITNPEMLIKSLTALNVMGAVTPRTALDAANKILQVNLPPYPQKGEEGYDPYMDKPIIFAAKGQSGNTGIDPAFNGKPQAAQKQKPDAIKQQENTGDISQKSPENGQQ